MRFEKKESGQILLFIVLIMTIALTVGLSLAARSVSNLRTVAEEKNSEQAFSAAEAGIEQALTNNAPVSGSFANNASYQTTLVTLSGTEFLLNGGTVIPKDTAADVWLSTYPGYTNPVTGSVTLYWGTPSDTCTTSETTNTMAALEVITISGTKAAPQTTSYAFDPCQARSSSNHFTYVNSGGGTVSNQPFAYKATVAVTSGLLMRIIPLYAPVTIGIRGCDGAGNNCITLPNQGTLIQSIGTADTTARKILSFRGYPKVPLEIFPYLFFSPK